MRHFVPHCCFYCGDTENLIEDVDEYIQNLLEHFSVIRHICINYRRQGKEAKTWGKRFFKKKKNKQREHKWLFKCQFKMCVLIKGTETTCICSYPEVLSFVSRACLRRQMLFKNWNLHQYIQYCHSYKATPSVEIYSGVWWWQLVSNLLMKCTMSLTF